MMVGHTPRIWLSGEEPSSSEWMCIRDMVHIRNADAIFDVTEFINSGGNFQTASDLWRFNFLYKFGGWYCDTDAYALKKFNIDRDWVVCSAEVTDNLLSIGVIKAPKWHPMFLDCIKNIQKTWGNVKVFSECYKNYFGNTNPTVDNKIFYPWTWKEYDSLYKWIKTKDLIKNGTKSIHLYHSMLKRNNIQCELVRTPCILNTMIQETEKWVKHEKKKR